MKKEAQTRADLSHVAKLIDDIPIALPTTSWAGGALARRTMAVLKVEAPPPNGERRPGHLVGADAKAERSVGSFAANLGKRRRAEPEAGAAPR